MLQAPCPACAAPIDVAPETLELGDDVTCPACRELLEVLGVAPLALGVVRFDDAFEPNGLEEFEGDLFDD